jgi:HlyD family secretion protein
LGSLVLAALAAACGPAGAPTVYPGTIEVHESDAAPLVPGRIVEMRVDEGDTVQIGDTLAILTQGAIPAMYEERRARLAAARARLADLERGSRSAELQRAEAEVAALEAEAERTASEYARARRLAADGVLAPQELDRAKAAAESAAGRLAAARASLELAREGTRADQVQAARAEVRSAEAQVESARADVSELAVLAAVDGVVLGRHADPGEVVAAGTPLATIGETGRPWVRVYLPARLLAALEPGAEALVLPAGAAVEAEAGPAAGVGVRGRLSAVSAKAEFTPRAALTEEERADLLFGARVALEDPPAGFRPGLPVTVRFTRESP